MFGIIAFHFSDHGTIKLAAFLPLNFNWAVLAFSSIFGGFTNCVFMLITGYFLVNKKFKVQSLVRLYGQVWFYSVLTGTLAFVTGVEEFSSETMIAVMFPFLHNEYWYFTSYIIIYLLFPYLNVIIEKLNRSQHKALVTGGIVLVSALHIFSEVEWTRLDNRLPVFFVMYFAGAYIS